MPLESIAPGLARWTAPHPDWKPEVPEDHPLDWSQDVGCVAATVGEAAVLIDPLVPEDLWPELDAFIAGRPVVVLTTVPFHVRSSAQVVERYAASMDVPPGVSAHDVPHAGEQVFWLPEHSTLVPGDSLINRPLDPGLRIPPVQWLDVVPGGTTVSDVAADLHQLLHLPIERILVSHGEPVLEDGRAALERALAV